MAPLIPEPLMHPHWDCVSDQLRDIITSIGQMPPLDNFYLAGGTALALQLGHRISVDLDFFFDAGFWYNGLEALVDFSTADQQAPIQTYPPIDWATIQAFCHQEVQRLGRIWFEQDEELFE